MEVHDSEVRRPRDLCDLGDAQLVRMASGREGDSGRLDPLRPLLGDTLLVDLLALDPVREPAELRRSLAQRANDPVTDRDVVVDQVALRVAGLGEQHLVRVRDLDGSFSDLQLDERRRHGVTLLAVGQRPAPADTPLHRSRFARPLTAARISWSRDGVASSSVLSVSAVSLPVTLTRGWSHASVRATEPSLVCTLA